MADDATNTQTTADVPWHREYRYPRGHVALTVFLAADFTACFTLVAVMVHPSDLGYLAYWPVPLRVAFLLFCLMIAGASVSLFLTLVPLAIAALRHRRDRVLLSEAGVTIVQDDVPFHFPWEQLIVSHGLYHHRFRMEGRECRVLSGFANEGELWREVAARTGSGPRWRERLAAGEAVVPAQPHEMRLILLLFAGLGLICVVMALVLPLVPPIGDQPASPRVPWALGLSLAGVGLVLLCLGLASTRLLRAVTIQLLPEELRLRTRHGRRKLVPYADLLSLRWDAPSKWDPGTRLQFTYADPSARAGERHLRFDSGGLWPAGLLEALRDELVRRRGLVPAPKVRPRDPDTWARPSGPSPDRQR